MAKEKQQLILDLEELYPGDSLKLTEKNTIYISALGTGELAILGKKFKALLGTLKTKGITFDNYNEPENMLELATVLVDEAPNILADAANLEVDQMLLLPPESIVAILDKVIEVNMRSKESLMGNFNRLMGRFDQKKDKAEEKTSESPKSSKS